MFSHTKEGFCRFRLAISRLFSLAMEDMSDIFKGLRRVITRKYETKTSSENYDLGQDDNKNTEKPIKPLDNTNSYPQPVIFVSACVDAKNPGGWKYNGGIKMLNLLVKQLRNHGYEAYMVTYDGTYEPWLIQHQPHISITEYRDKVKTLPNVRCVTSWALAKAFTEEASNLYFWDMELAYTDHTHFSTIYSLLMEKHMQLAGCNSMICAWHMATWRVPCTLLIDWIDDEFWFPIEEERERHKIGYMLESEHTEREIDQIKEITDKAGLSLDFQMIRGGTEQDCLNLMRSCNIFLGMNHGKDPLWGEGFGLPMMEAMSVGCVVIAYDIIGNREFLHNGFNGILVPKDQPDIMANRLVELYKNPQKTEQMRENAYNMFCQHYESENRWPEIRVFLDLNE